MELPPKEDRPDGMEVLAFYRGKWTHVKWSKEKQQFHLGYGQPFILDGDRAWAELPQKPENADGFYDW